MVWNICGVIVVILMLFRMIVGLFLLSFRLMCLRDWVVFVIIFFLVVVELVNEIFVIFGCVVSVLLRLL